MNDARTRFEQICDQLIEEDGVVAGKMMASPGLKYGKKVFLFYHDGELGAKLGRDADLGVHGISVVKHLSPFKNKAPLYNWYMISWKDAERWSAIAAQALEYIRNE